jgi:spore maturation protein CgeB
MAQMGWCPSGRLFEAAACGVAVLSDDWQGLEHFFTPNNEILVARRESDALAALDLPDAELERIGRAARERVMAEHTSERRAIELLTALETARQHAGRSSPVERHSLPVEA